MRIIRGGDNVMIKISISADVAEKTGYSDSEVIEQIREWLDKNVSGSLIACEEQNFVRHKKLRIKFFTREIKYE